MSENPAPPARVGRPRRSSRQMLEDAASELFLEQGYPTTSLESITQRAGVSRNTFFNYFSSKSDLLWIDLDHTLAALPGALAETEPGIQPIRALRDCIERVAAGHPDGLVPWSLSQADLMDTRADLEASALPRLMSVAAAIETFLRPAVGTDSSRTVAYVAAAASASGVAAWISAGVRRKPLHHYVARALEPALAGFEELS